MTTAAPARSQCTGGDCAFECDGAACQFQCDPGTSSMNSCPGGDCRQQRMNGGDCTLDCPGMLQCNGSTSCRLTSCGAGCIVMRRGRGLRQRLHRSELLP